MQPLVIALLLQYGMHDYCHMALLEQYYSSSYVILLLVAWRSNQCSFAMDEEGIQKWMKRRSYTHYSGAEDASTSAAIKEVAKAIESTGAEKWMKRGSYTHYSGETLAKIARYTCSMETMEAADKFSHELGKPLPELTVKKYEKT